MYNIKKIVYVKREKYYYEIFKSYPFAPIPFSGMNNTYLTEEEQFVAFFLQMIYPKKDRKKEIHLDVTWKRNNNSSVSRRISRRWAA